MMQFFRVYYDGCYEKKMLIFIGLSNSDPCAASCASVIRFYDFRENIKSYEFNIDEFHITML